MSYYIKVSPTGKLSDSFMQVAPTLRMLDKWTTAYEDNGWTIHDWFEA